MRGEEKKRKKKVNVCLFVWHRRRRKRDSLSERMSFFFQESMDWRSFTNLFHFDLLSIIIFIWIKFLFSSMQLGFRLSHWQNKPYRVL